MNEMNEIINSIAVYCNETIGPFEHDGARRAYLLFQKLAKPYIDAMVEQMANVPKAPFAVAVLDGTSLVPFEEAD